jgi:hypothetical protein
MGGVVAIVVGVITTSLAFATQATASQPAAVSVAACAANGWNDSVTITNSPRVSNGIATISRTGTGLDGLTLGAGGGQQTIVLHEPASVASVTVTGALTWSKNYTAPFTTTATKPTTCVAGAVGPQAAAVAPAAAPDKVYVCKYVGKPGVDERLQPGNNNPIDVSVNAIPQNPVVVGSFFADAQGRSFVLAFDTGQTPPTAADCPDVTIVPPTDTVTATTTIPGPTVTVTGPTTTVTVTVPVTTTATVTTPGPTVTVPGPTTTVIVPGPTVTLTETATVTNTATATVTNPVTVTVTATVTNNVTNNVTVTASPRTVTATATVTDTVVGQAATVTETVAGQGQTVTETVSNPAVTVLNTVTDSVVNCPPGAGIAGAGAGIAGGGAGAGTAGSLAYTGSGDNAAMSLLGGALTAAGFTCMFMTRRRRVGRQH